MDQLTFWAGVSLALKTFFIYCFALLLVRVSSRRLLNVFAGFDLIVTILLGSVLSRSINGTASLLSSIIAGSLIVFLHWLTSVAVYHSKFFRVLVRGRHRLLIKNGSFNWEEMEKAHILDNDLLIELRKENGTEKIEEVQEARLETSGQVVFLMKEKNSN